MRLFELGSEQRHEIYVRVRDDAVWSSRYVILLTLSTVIASFGLLANSAAVVIGAMIIAPLMGPILGLSMGMVAGATSLERRSALSEIIGVGLCIGIACVIGKLPFTFGVSQEMLARTAPTTFDIAIAIASGVAGAYATINTKVNSAIAGVAISVALVPPLASCGLLMALGDAKLGFGAFLLWLANFLSIHLASAVVFALFGLGRGEIQHTGPRMLLRFIPSIVALGLVGWFLTATLLRLFAEHRMEEMTKDVLSRQIARRTGGRLDQILQISQENGATQIVASVLTPQAFDPVQVKEIELDLRRQVVPDAKLIIRSLVSQDVGDEGRVYLTESERQQRDLSAEEADFLERARETLKQSLTSHEAAELVEVERSQAGGDTRITAVVRAPMPVEPAEVARAEDALMEVLHVPIHLIIRSISTQDADGTEYLHLATNQKKDPELEKLRSGLERILDGRLTALGLAGVTDITLNRRPTFIEAVVTAESPAPPPIPAVRKLQADLVKYFDPRVRLSIHAKIVVGGAR